MNEYKAMRIAYGEYLEKIGSNEKIVVLDADLSSATMTSLFAKRYPDRFFNCGIAEANMIGMSVGLAHQGFIPVVSTFSVFGTGRGFEQIRNSVAYQKANVKLCMTHAGITFAEDGGSHQTIEDIALMRVLPGMIVIVPSDANQIPAAIDAAIQHKGPVYVRIGRIPARVLPEQPFELGKANILVDGKDGVIFACGLMVEKALDVAELLAEDGEKVAVVNVHTIKPLDRELIIHMQQKCGKVVTLEEHSVIGGLGDAVADVLAGSTGGSFMKIGVQDCFGQTGSPDELLEHYGLSVGKIYEKVKDFFKK